MVNAVAFGEVEKDSTEIDRIVPCFIAEDESKGKDVVARRVVSGPKSKVLLSRSRLGNEHG